jgi:hypothetical protein
VEAKDETINEYSQQSGVQLLISRARPRVQSENERISLDKRIESVNECPPVTELDQRTMIPGVKS